MSLATRLSDFASLIGSVMKEKLSLVWETIQAISWSIDIGEALRVLKSSWLVATFWDWAYASKWFQIRDWANFANKWGLQANNNIWPQWAGLMISSKVLAFKANVLWANAQEFTDVTNPDFWVDIDSNFYVTNDILAWWAVKISDWVDPEDAVNKSQLDLHVLKAEIGDNRIPRADWDWGFKPTAVVITNDDRITNLTDAINYTDAVTKSQLDKKCDWDTSIYPWSFAINWVGITQDDFDLLTSAQQNTFSWIII